LTKNSNKFLSILVEVPTKSIGNLNDNEWKNCINNINNIKNINVGFYMPTNDLRSCSPNNLTLSKKKECIKNYTKIIHFLTEANINNITFDFSGYEAINHFAGFKNFKWHIWHINSIKSFNKILNHKNIGIMLLSNDNFSNNLN